MGWPWVTLLGSIVSVVATASAPLASPSGPDAVAPAPAPALRVTLLGTAAGPAARSTRSQPASLLQVGGKTYLIDAGDGVLRQLASAGVQPGAVDAIFITHLHFDHTAGLPAFLAFDWQNRRRDPVTILGPAGTHDLVRDAIKVFQSSVDIFHSQQ
ncbi:MAG TPA: MBL fold metallo-hydrolase, partial [Hyphomicrobium sp.]|nr:MBL fold metallo-hydrolase [Hyphomicrobium sp.]